jgi:hypothetical protein
MSKTLYAKINLIHADDTGKVYVSVKEDNKYSKAVIGVLDNTWSLTDKGWKSEDGVYMPTEFTGEK